MCTLRICDVVYFGPGGREVGDCLVENGRIIALGDVPAPVGNSSSFDTVDGKGRWLWPGIIDGHVHFREPGDAYKEDWTSGSSAAVAGGVTSVLEMPNTRPATTTLENLQAKRAIARSKSLCNYGFFFGASPENSEQYTRAAGVAGLKIFMGCSTGDLLVAREDELERVFATYEQRICVHAESEWMLEKRAAEFAGREDPAVHSQIRSPEVAAEAVRLACRMALKYGRHLHILHLSTQLELEIVQEARGIAREQGLAARITCEVCPHHLFLNTSAYEMYGTRVQMNPPLRGEHDREAMWRALLAGQIDMIATDHAPHSPEEKSRPYRQAPSGVPGVQTMLPLMLDAAFRGICSYEDVLRWLCTGPAEVWGIEGRGRLEVGAHADLVLIDPRMRRTVTDHEQFSRCGWTPWSGRTLTGWPVMTWVGGQLVYHRADHEDGRAESDSGAIVGRPGTGQELTFKELDWPA